MTYEQTLSADTAIAVKTLESLDPVTGVVLPQNMVKGVLVTQGVDNLDVAKESSTAGNVGYHGTQHVVYHKHKGSSMSI